ncbi:ATP-binding cassette domain-containing protein [Vibrio sp. JC009]|uniref:ATP-binding cassette domain-containing protein n=1 Tax=Vibrio sp. JC009 TaxID=2912314 RepID=UPI0023AF1FC1|nr:ATP-binding cassette domain-containing protein [Vibrio sp. JC009]WED20711.1 ATP-binding cassette domain-containing protein [Vibrio sp. JC009]
MSLQLKNLTISKTETGETLFPPVSFEVEKGEVLTLMGPSGCGKSTLLSAIAGHLAGDFSYSGEILLDASLLNKEPPHKRKAGILFQDDLLFPHLTVWENMAFALPDSVKGKPRKEKVLQVLETVELTSLANAYPEQISGGQRARISLLRMLLAEPKVALLDEPFNKLDKELRQTFRDWVFSQLALANIPALMVTHDHEDVPDNSPCLIWPWK